MTRKSETKTQSLRPANTRNLGPMDYGRGMRVWVQYHEMRGEVVANFGFAGGGCMYHVKLESGETVKVDPFNMALIED